MTTVLKALAIGAALLAVTPAQAARQFSFSFDAPLTNGDTLQGRGVLTTDDGMQITPGSFSYGVLGVTGFGRYDWMTTEAAITGLIAGERGEVRSTGGFYSIGSLPLTFAGTPDFFSIVNNRTGISGSGQDGVRSLNVRFTLTPLVTAVPEPASWALMIGGIGVVGMAVRQRRRGTVAAA